MYIYFNIWRNKTNTQTKNYVTLVSSTRNMCSTTEQPGSNILSNEFNFIIFLYFNPHSK